jgi:von Willebrand factor type A domain
VQIALLLDTSGSMEGLIHQARARLWDIVNDFSLASKNGIKPTLQVAVYQYGSDQLPSSEGFLRCVQPLTSDLDLISDRLFSLSISGSAEYCGMAMDSAVKQLSWDSTPATAPASQLPLRMIVIAGNEEFTQGPVDYAPVARAARERGILINTIFCGNRSEGERTGWQAAAAIARSCYNAIDHSQPLAEVRTPYDDAIMRLNTQLNTTYIPYGASGERSKTMQAMQDSVNIGASPSAGVSRAASKASSLYRNTTWDLVDAKKDGKDIATIPTSELPEIMRPMTIDERLAYVMKLEADRARVQAEIAALNVQRTDFLKRHAQTAGRPETLDSAIIKCVRTQATAIGFTYSRD